MLGFGLCWSLVCYGVWFVLGFGFCRSLVFVGVLVCVGGLYEWVACVVVGLVE